MRFYKLVDGVYLIKGALNGALCNTNTGEVYSLNPIAVSILSGHEINHDYWNQLVELGLAEPTEQCVDLPELPRISNNTLKFIWFEIMTSDCNEACLHCYADSMPPSYRKAQGLDVDNTELGTVRKLSYQNWIYLIEEGYRLGARSCQFIGGEPMLYHAGDKGCLDLAEHAVNVGYKFVEIFTNATLLTAKKIARIKKLGLHIAVSLYSDDPKTHDMITRVEGSHAKTVNALNLLKEAEIPTRVETTLMRQNQERSKQTIEFVNSLGFNGKMPDPIRPKGRGDKVALSPDLENVARYGIITNPRFSATMNKMTHYRNGHSCLSGKITITETGDVLPCIFTRNHIVGNVIITGNKPVSKFPT